MTDGMYFFLIFVSVNRPDIICKLSQNSLIFTANRLHVKFNFSWKENVVVFTYIIRIFNSLPPLS